MSKAFVNKNFQKIEGKQLFEAEKQKVEKQIKEESGTKPTAEAVEKATSETQILLADGNGGILVGVCTDPKLEKTKTTIIITILEDASPIATIDKNALIDACNTKRKEDELTGIVYLVPLVDHVVMLDYKFENRIDAIGDISGLNFYFKK